MTRRRRFFIKAALSRFLFFLHGGMVVIWILMIRHGDLKSVYFGSTLYLLPVEMLITLRCTKHGEWKWFSPALMLYLFTVVPGIGFLHVDIHERRMKTMGEPGVIQCEQMVKNTSAFPEIDYDKTMEWMAVFKKSITLTEWPQVLEQTTMFLVILGRWMLPKGNLSREQLSQLLLVYLGMAADILEFSSESLAQPVVACDLVKIGIVTGIWGMSLCQFTLVLTSVAGPKIRNFKNKKRKRGQGGAEGKTEDPLAGFVEQDINEKRPSICGSEIWSLLLVLFMQDCPFLAMRLYLITKINVVDRAMLFFAGKNLLVFMLVTYRIIVLCGEHNDKTKVRPVPLVGFPQQPQVDAMIVRKQRSSWSLDPLLSRVTDFTNRLRNHVQVLDREIGRKRGVHVPSESDRPTTKPMTPFLVAMEGHSVEVTEIDTIESVTLDTTETEIIDTARPLSSTVDDGTTKPGEISPILKLHHDDQPVPSVVEVGNDFEEIISLSDDSVKENLQAAGNELTLGLGNDDQMTPAI